MAIAFGNNCQLLINNFYIDFFADYQDLNASLLSQNENYPWIKDALSFGTGATVGTLAGVGTSTVASSVFVQAGLWTSIQSFFGVSTGIVVGASAYSLLTLFAPVGLGVLATLRIYNSLTDWNSKEQAAEMSKFLSEILIAALPMAWIDGELADQEKDAVDRLMTTSGIRKEEREPVYQAIKKRKTFDEIIQTSILFDDKHREKICRQSDKERLKHRLMLSAAWEIAIAGDVLPS
ncbi:MAG: hypothetical protein WA919_30260 [Coleofasciculaceae cyanobacterium]